MEMDSIIYLYQRDLDRLREEVELYPDERLLWKVLPGSSNSGGNLALHLLGNLNHFIGHLIGETDYKREREKEFSSKELSKESLLDMIDACQEAVIKSLKKMDHNLMKEAFPVQVFKDHFTYEKMIIHLAGHLNYHLGQINYHRRYFSEFN